MFTFNFSGNQTPSHVSVSDSEQDGDEPVWLPCVRLDLSVSSDCVSISDSDHAQTPYREICFHRLVVRVLKREIAMDFIGRDVDSPQRAVIAESNSSDLEVAKYEGGLKVWECSQDLGEYLVHEVTERGVRGKDVLDLGCGSGVVGIVALLLGAKSVTFQDYNSEVLTHWTSHNVGLNIAQKANSDAFEFWSGDWGEFAERCNTKFDLVLTSETVYNPQNYDKLCRLLQSRTKPSSTVYLAAKSVYFSLGGSVCLFLDHLDRCRLFAHRQVFKSDAGVQRVIVEIKRAEPCT